MKIALSARALQVARCKNTPVLAGVFFVIRSNRIMVGDQDCAALRSAIILMVRLMMPARIPTAITDR